MTALSGGTLAKLKTSLADSAKGWSVTAGLEHTTTVGGGEGATVMVTKTYQLTSSALATIIIAGIEYNNGTFTEIVLTWSSQSFTTTDSALKTTLETMAGIAATAKAAALDTLLS